MWRKIKQLWWRWPYLLLWFVASLNLYSYVYITHSVGKSSHSLLEDLQKQPQRQIIGAISPKNTKYKTQSSLREKRTEDDEIKIYKTYQKEKSYKTVDKRINHKTRIRNIVNNSSNVISESPSITSNRYRERTQGISHLSRSTESDGVIDLKNNLSDNEKNVSSHNEVEDIVNSCQFTNYQNMSVFSSPEFMPEYSRYSHCISAEIISDIAATIGGKGELVVSCVYKYPVSCLPCQEEGRKLTFLYLVLSTNPVARRAIRDTWGRKAEGRNLGKGKAEFEGRVVFLLSKEEGKVGRSENEKFGDIIVVDIPTKHQFFQHKQRLSALNWAWTRCSLSRYMVLTDDTTFINVDRINTFANIEMYSANRMYGSLLREMEPGRSPGRHHLTPSSSYPWSHYPPFLAPPTAILSSDTVPRLLAAANNVPLFKIWEVWLTGLLCLDAHIMRIGIKDFLSPSLPPLHQECDWAKFGGISGVEPARMAEVSNNLKSLLDGGVFCIKQIGCKVKIDPSFLQTNVVDK